MKILIVEDDTFLSRGYEIQFQEAGHEVSVAKDGREALELLTKFQPEVIVLDLVMPKMDGFAVLEQLRKDDNFKTVPVMAVTNLGNKSDKDRCMSLGASEYIVKTDVTLSDIVKKAEAYAKQ
ncbi:hypothetical protein A2801_00475 [Candidatus Woesebacteria bacterium RIFCSPHIGHO2_01_FULL_41_10]|uniref:Response regulatory domain-containing protein n=1 Tax=Candidatus Woesebacteria bacterium RIFCSPHIGHO2_01_FULL_41_10 TaxID=1802500 RepID=A0A1F7YSQ5_9BACT|nr:MAG: hypothetical protein A2801_00475 [Candidatus Woesebacteria bacterium RIFCSPHIGHO2_01_FULL_41_10]